MSDDTATTAATTAATDEQAAAYEFPFPVPEDLSAATEADLRALHGQVREHAGTFTGLGPAEHTDESLAALEACRDLAVAIATELSARRDRADRAAALGADIEATGGDDGTDDEGDTGGEGDPADGDTGGEGGTTAVTAARPRVPAPRIRDVARGSRVPRLPQDAAEPRYAVLAAASDLAGFSSGQVLTRFEDAARILSTRIDQYPAITAQRARGGAKRPVTVYVSGEPGRQFELRNFNRHAGVELRRQFPDELRVNDGDDRRGYRVAEYASSERRLPGGSLIESARTQLKAGRSLTAGVGWCAPSETIYELMELETLDGILDSPTLQTNRGGWQIPIDGGPDFAQIYGVLGNAGNTHLSEADVANEAIKYCTEIPCPDFEDVRLGVDYYCLTGGLLQRRGYPEVVARFGRGAVTALAHKMNAGYIAAILAGSGVATIIPADPSGDDAASALMAAIDLAITDAKYRNRMGFNATLEVVLPWWVLAQIRAAMSRRLDAAMLAVTDAQILEWFTIRRAVPRFVYDWQDAFSGLATGPGAAIALSRLPTTVQMLVYPAGTWVKAVQDVVALDTIYDSTLLTTNQFTAVFAEDGWAALKMGPTSRLYTVPVDPSGVVGCCPSNLTS